MANVSITEKCIRYSKPFIKAMQKHGVELSLLKIQSSESSGSIYDDFYEQGEISYDEPITINAILNMNPLEDFYKDYHLNTKGDAVITIMSYQLQQQGLMEDKLIDYQSIPKLLIGNHIRNGNDYYRIDEIRQDAIYQGIPLTCICVLTFLETRSDDNG